MESSGFFTSHSVQGVYDRAYTASQYSEYFAHFIGNGVFPNPSSQLQVVSRSGWNVAMLEGFAWINGYWYKEDYEKLFTIDYADDFLDRIDAVVVQWNKDTRLIHAEIKKGLSSTSAQRPVMQRDDNIYELCLAYIDVRRGSTQITQANITDMRLDKGVCGIVHGLIEQVDTTTIHKQYQEILKEEMQMYQTWFQSVKDILDVDLGIFWAWFNSIKEILNESVAANLLEMINTNADIATDAANITKGTLEAARLPTTILTTNTAQSISAVKTIFANIVANSQTITPAQLGFLSGVTSSIQTQITNAQNTANTANTAAAAAQLTANNAWTLAAGMTSIVSGTYTGNGTSNYLQSMEVKLGFKPKAVFVMNNEGKTFEVVPNGNNTLYYYHGGLAVPGGDLVCPYYQTGPSGYIPAPMLEITENGFRVTSFYSGGYSGYNSTLNSGIKYYVAFK